jgi:hypothetical protein
MATTTNYNWETPDDTDLVKDGALAIRTLGSAVDTTVFNNAAAAIAKSIVDAKGDLIVGTGADTVARLAVGTNGYTLVADSAETTGLKWAAPAGGSTFVGASAYKSAGQTISNNTQTAITWSNEYFDTDAFHSTVTNTSRFTIPSGKDGKYLFTATARFAANSTGIRSWTYYKNGSGAMQPTAQNALSSGGSAMSAVYATSLVAGDYIELFCFQTSGGNLDILSDADNTYITVIYLGA